MKHILSENLGYTRTVLLASIKSQTYTAKMNYSNCNFINYYYIINYIIHKKCICSWR